MADSCVIQEHLIAATNRFARSEKKYCCCRLLKHSSQEKKFNSCFSVVNAFIFGNKVTSQLSYLTWQCLYEQKSNTEQPAIALIVAKVEIYQLLEQKSWLVKMACLSCQRMNSKLVKCQIKAINIRFNGKHSLMLNYGDNETVHKIWQTCYKIWLKLEIT